MSLARARCRTIGFGQRGVQALARGTDYSCNTIRRILLKRVTRSSGSRAWFPTCLVTSDPEHASPHARGLELVTIVADRRVVDGLPFLTVLRALGTVMQHE
jgi:hypothetical protein